MRKGSHPLKDRISPLVKFIYGSGDTGFSLTTTIIGAYFAIFLTDIVGIAPSIAAAAIFIGRSWDYINDPIIGHISDRTRTRWGRRRPFLLFGGLPFALTFLMLWWIPPWENVILQAVYYSVAYILFDAAATFLYMPYFALTPEMTSDYDERTSLTTYRMFFSILGSLLAFTIPLMLIGTFAPENASRVFTMALLFGVISILPFFPVFLVTRERPEFIEQEKPSLSQSLLSAKNNPPFLYGLAIYLMTWISIEIVQAILIFYIKYVVQREPDSDLLMGSIFVTAILALPIWERVSKKWGKRRAYIAGVAFWAGVQLVLISVSSSTSLPIILILCILAGIGVAAAHVLPWAIIPDAIEWGEWKNGERHEGMYYSLITLTKKAAASFAVPLALLLLDATGYVPVISEQPASALWGIRIVMGPIPAVLLCIGIFFAFRYPLDREKFAQIVRELEDRRGFTKETSI
jgi:GPH family glycoside/pentoside/hexuronide:cation symporter